MVRILTAFAAAAALFSFPTEKLHAENLLETEDGLKGTIVDLVTGETLIGAAILIEGTTEGTVTDIDGAYTLPLDPGSYDLSVSYIGYKPMNLDVTINPDGSGTVETGDPTSLAYGENGLTIYLEPAASSVLAAKLCLEGAEVAGDSLYFFAPAVSAGSWITQNRTYFAAIGSHHFYR